MFGVKFEFRVKHLVWVELSFVQCKGSQIRLKVADSDSKYLGHFLFLVLLIVVYFLLENISLVN